MAEIITHENGTTTTEPLVAVRYLIPHSIHRKLTQYQRKLAVKKGERITQEQAIIDLLSKLKV